MAAFYTFQDHSGSETPKTSDNPYQDLISACHNDTIQIRNRYEAHRINRNAQQKAKFLSADFQGVIPDEILAKLEDQSSLEPKYTDWRHCMVFWARPPSAIRELIIQIQAKLKQVVPELWTMPAPNLHMTAMEITHSRTEEEIADRARRLAPHAARIADLTFERRARLVRPLVSFDAQALALSFLPAVGEAGRRGLGSGDDDDGYTYHHLRRDLFDEITATGVAVESRYAVPSAHLTIARFIRHTDLCGPDGSVDPGQVRKLVETIDELNAWLEREFWPDDANGRAGLEWIVGQELGLDHRIGTLWYGGGDRVCAGRGF